MVLSSNGLEEDGPAEPAGSRFRPNKYPVHLSEPQRAELEQLCSRGQESVRKVRRARILLLSDRNREGGHWTRQQIANALGVHVNCVDKVRKAFALAGQQAETAIPQAITQAIAHRYNPASAPKPTLDGAGEAQLIAICCSDPPEGRTYWTMQMLADEMVSRKIVTQISDETCRRVLKKTS